MKTSWALLIDAENVPVGHAKRLLDRVCIEGEIATARVFGNFDKLKGWLDAAGPLSIGVRHLSPVSGTKNAADIALAVEAMNLLHSRFPPVGFCIASSDSDFVPLALELKAAGRRVIGAGMHPPTAFLRAAYHEWHQLDAEMNIASRPPASPRDPFVVAVEKAMNGSEWVHLSQLGNTLCKNGHPKPKGGFRATLMRFGYRERKINGGYEIARPL
jgi:hypothetical protein